jgi:hypothetical protein
MADRKNNNDITLESLLKLKRNERPEGEFWDSFEQDFQRRRLHALVEQTTIRESFWSSGMKALVFGLPALLLVGLSFVWSPGTASLHNQLGVTNQAPALNTGIPESNVSTPLAVAETFPTMASNMASSQFVVDAIPSSSSSGVNFRKVLYTPAIRLSAPTGAFYVKDSMSSSNYRVTTADGKLGRNF